MSRPRRYAVNDRVVYTSHDPGERQQKGTVTAVHPDGAADLRLDDGSFQYVVPADRLKLEGKEP